MLEGKVTAFNEKIASELSSRIVHFHILKYFLTALAFEFCGFVWKSKSLLLTDKE